MSHQVPHTRHSSRTGRPFRAGRGKKKFYEDPEWQEYARYRYEEGTSLDFETWKKVKQRVDTVDRKQVAQTIVRQIYAQEQFPRPRWNVRKILSTDSGIVLNTVQGKSTVNVSINYNRGSDMYDLKFSKIKPDSSVRTVESREIFAGQLADVIDHYLQNVVRDL